MKESNLIAILVVSMLVTFSFVSLTPAGAQNTSTSQAAVGGQTLEQLTKALLNPVWLAYEQNRTAEKAITTTTATGNSLGHIPSPVDLSYFKGKMAAGAAQTYAASYDLRTVGKVTSVKIRTLDKSEASNCRSIPRRPYGSHSPLANSRTSKDLPGMFRIDSEASSRHWKE